MNKNQIHMRSPKPSDLNFIQATFLKSMKKESHLGRSCSSRVFFSEFPQVMDYILSRSKIMIAHLEDEPDFILSYMIYEPHCIHYIYTRAIHQRSNLARDLINEAFPSAKTLTFTLNTHASKKISEKYPELIHNPFILFQKGNYDE